MPVFSQVPCLLRAVSCLPPHAFSTDWVSEDWHHGGLPIALRMGSPSPPLAFACVVSDQRLVRVTQMHYILGLFPLVSLHGRPHIIFEGFCVSLYDSLLIVALFHVISSKSWFVNISTLGTFIGWWTINLTFIRFCKAVVDLLSSRSGTDIGLSGAACRVQGVNRYDRTRFAYTSPFQPYLSAWGLVWVTFFILTKGFAVFYKWDTSAFISSCA